MYKYSIIHQKNKEWRQFLLPLFISLVYLQIGSPALGQNTSEIIIPFRVVEWNVENLFDLKHDSSKNDQEFLPEGLRKWNYNKLKTKLDNISRVIAAIGEWTPPALIGLCEVENDSVLIQLTRYAPLKEYGYRYVITHSPDPRGIDVALLYQPGVFKLIATTTISVSPPPGCKPTRDLLHASGKILTGDTLDIIMCHFPSRSGNSKSSESYRQHVAHLLRHKADSLMNTRQQPQLIIMGDFNDYPTSRSMREILNVNTPSVLKTTEASDLMKESPIHPRKLYHLLLPKCNNKEFGSYKYRGFWQLIDHIIVSGNLLNTSRHFFTSEEKADVFRIPFLLTKDKQYGGVEPYRTYKGMRYQGGFSDHLPIYADFMLTITP